MQNRDQRWPNNYRGRQGYEGRGTSYGERDATDRYAHREKIADRYRSDHDMSISRSRYDNDESSNRGQDYEYNRDFSNRENTHDWGRGESGNHDYSNRDYDSRAYSNMSDRTYSRNDYTNTNSSPYSGNSWRSPARFEQSGRAGLYGGGNYEASNYQRSDYSPRDNEKHGVMDDIKSFFGFGPKNYKRSDERIREDICEALTYDHDVDASHIDVSVKDSVVTLTGTVMQRSAKRLAEDLAEKVRGVTDVRNELNVRNMLLDEVGTTTSSAAGSSSERLTEKAKNRLT